MQPVGDQAAMEPGQPKSSLPLIIMLVVLIALGVIFFASWLGWVKLFGLEKLWGRGTDTEEVTQTPVSNTNINDAKRKEDLSNLKTALKNYYTATQGYPVAVATEKTSEPSSLKVLIPDYITSLPVDPLAPTYYYGYKSDGKTFELTCILEDKNDTSGVVMGNNFLYIITDATAESASSTNNSANNGTNSSANTNNATIPTGADSGASGSANATSNSNL